MEIRNIAVIAHVDHGKTTLTDALMRQTGMARGDFETMDTDALERERGITIYSKNTSVLYKGTKINIVDTPGHADFGSEVERVLRSIDSVLLVVDAQEGPMPQTKFVLKKSIELGLKPIVVINKIDKPAANPEMAHERVLELFMNLGASDKQLDFTTIYAVGRDGVAKRNISDSSTDLTPLLDAILEEVPAANAGENGALPFVMQPFNLAYNDFFGRMAIGRVYSGSLSVGARVFVKKPSGETRRGKVIKLYTFDGLERKESEKIEAGDIVMVAGIEDVDIGETICEKEDQAPRPAISVDEPTISVNLLVNNSPFSGRDGKFVTSRQIRERLEKELQVNVGLKVDFSANDYFRIYGRGEMHIAVLFENMRREGYEFQVSQPKVIIKEENGERLEPFEEVTIDVSNDLSGTVITKMSKRKGIISDMNSKNGNIRILFEIPTRGLLGYRGQFVVDTKGEGILCSQTIGFKPEAGEIEKRDTGSMVSMASGKALAYSLFNLQDRGVLYVDPNTEVYEGMVVGNTAKGNDMSVNPIKGKHLTNMRASGSDVAIKLTPPLKITLERGLEIMADDEYLEITPKNIRLRKQFLKEADRTKVKRKQ